MPKLTDPIAVKGLHLANRLVMAPMVTANAVDHKVTDAHLAWYGERARNGVGMIIVECAGVAADGVLVPRQLGAWDDAQIPGLRRLAETIQTQKVPAVVQIVHGGSRAFRADASERIGASAVRLLPGLPARPLREDEIAGLVQAFAAAARRVQAAGFAGVEIHAAHYYLLSQFLSPYSNRRDDGYGGDLSGRARFLLEVVAAVRDAVGSDYPVFARLHCVEKVDGGLTTEEAMLVAQMLERAGVDLIDASGIGQSSLVQDGDHRYLSTSSALPKGAPAGEYVASAGRLKRAIGIPLLAVGKLAEGDLAKRALDQGDADLIAIGRQLITDPLTARKLLDGRGQDIVRCEECFTCFASIRKGPIRCSVNKDV